MYTTITSKFQAHLPVAARRKSGITQHGRVKVTAKKGKIILEPVKSKFLELAGKYKVDNPIPAEKIRSVVDYSDGKK